MKRFEAFSKNITTVLFRLTVFAIVAAFLILLFDYLFGVLVGWSAGIYFYILLGVASVLSVCSVPSAIFALRSNGHKKYRRPLYVAPFGAIYLIAIASLFWGSGT
jgi:hypothetical protein